MGRGLGMGRIGVLMGFLGVPLINGGWIGVLMGLWGSDRGFDGVSMGFLGVPLVNGGSDRGFDGF